MCVLYNSCLGVLSDPIKDQTDYEELWVRTSIERKRMQEPPLCSSACLWVCFSWGRCRRRVWRKQRKIKRFWRPSVTVKQVVSCSPLRTPREENWSINSTGDVNVCYLFIQSLIHLESSLGIKWRAELLHLMYSGWATNHPWQNQRAWWL